MIRLLYQVKFSGSPPITSTPGTTLLQELEVSVLPRNFTSWSLNTHPKEGQTQQLIPFTSLTLSEFSFMKSGFFVFVFTHGEMFKRNTGQIDAVTLACEHADPCSVLYMLQRSLRSQIGSDFEFLLSSFCQMAMTVYQTH